MTKLTIIYDIPDSYDISKLTENEHACYFNWASVQDERDAFKLLYDAEKSKNNGHNIFANWLLALESAKRIAKRDEETIDRAKLNAQRYEKVRRLAPVYYQRLWLASLGGEKTFDQLIDELCQKCSGQMKEGKAIKECCTGSVTISPTGA